MLDESEEKTSRENIEFNLPPKNRNGDTHFKGKTSLVLIGSNGAGKTRMSSWIEQNNHNISIHRVSAQKSLQFPKSISSTDTKAIRQKVLYGTNGDNDEDLEKNSKKAFRWSRNPDLNPLNDVGDVMTLLVSDYTDSVIKYKKNVDKCMIRDIEYKIKDVPNEKSCMDVVAEIWNKVIPDKKLSGIAGNIEASKNEGDNKEVSYSISELSDGEREIVYLLGEVLAAHSGSLIIIDEPENHLHRAILNKFWDEVENMRTDCVFLYITHDYDFALSRLNSQLIWVHGIQEKIDNGTSVTIWDYENVSSDESYLEPLLLELYGERKNILFVEGEMNSRSIDYRVYSRAFPEYYVIPVGSCENVIRAVDGCRGTRRINFFNAKGIIDRDRRSPNEIKGLKERGITVLKVAQVENLFLLPDIITLVYSKMPSNRALDEIIDDAKQMTLKHIKKSCVANELAFLFSKEILIRNINVSIFNKTNKNNFIVNGCFDKIIKDSSGQDTSEQDPFDLNAIAKQVLNEIDNAVNTSDFEKALSIDKIKDLLEVSQVPKSFGYNMYEYIDCVISLIGYDQKIGGLLMQKFRDYIELE